MPGGIYSSPIGRAVIDSTGTPRGGAWHPHLWRGLGREPAAACLESARGVRRIACINNDDAATNGRSLSTKDGRNAAQAPPAAEMTSRKSSGSRLSRSHGMPPHTSRGRGSVARPRRPYGASTLVTGTSLTSADATAALEQLVRVREPLANYSRCYASASLSTRSSIRSAASQSLFAWYLMID